MQSIHQQFQKEFANLPEKALQFGEGNFLRAFVDWMIELSNRQQNGFDGQVVLCQPIARGMADTLNEQNCQYTVLMRGMEDGVPIERTERISSVSRCLNPYEDYDSLLTLAKSSDLRVVISNTTEAGIAYHAGDCLKDRPPVSFPAKLCAFLYARYQAFGGDREKGLLMLPVELIDNNGHELERIVKQYAKEWELDSDFSTWLDEGCCFASTLVDRIVTGFPREEITLIEEKLGYTDKCLDTCEVFNLWVIEADKKWAEVFPVAKTSAHVIWTDDVRPYKKRKVRILNGAHTSTVLAAYLSGHEIVLDFMRDPIFKNFMNDLLLEEVVPVIDLPHDELVSFAQAVNDRFANPFIRHRLLDIALNSCSKYCARCLPSLLEYIERFNRLPQRLTFALAAFILFYRGEMDGDRYFGIRENGERYEIRDDHAVLEFFAKLWQSGDPAQVAHGALSNAALWSDHDLTQINGLEKAVTHNLKAMIKNGVRLTIEHLQEE